MAQRHKGSKYCWKNGKNRLVQHKIATNLQSVKKKKAVSAKHNKMKYVYIRSHSSKKNLRPENKTYLYANIMRTTHGRKLEVQMKFLRGVCADLIDTIRQKKMRLSSKKGIIVFPDF